MYALKLNLFRAMEITMAMVMLILLAMVVVVAMPGVGVIATDLQVMDIVTLMVVQAMVILVMDLVSNYTFFTSKAFNKIINSKTHKCLVGKVHVLFLDLASIYVYCLTRKKVVHKNASEGFTRSNYF